MPVIYQKIISRQDLQANPDVLYVFGDNDLRRGLGGQAGAMRGEPNAIGVRTKHAPGMREEDFFSDDDLEQNLQAIMDDLIPVGEHLESGGIVIYPLDGIGTGLSEMPKRCPRTFAYLQGIGLGIPTDVSVTP